MFIYCNKLYIKEFSKCVYNLHLAEVIVFSRKLQNLQARYLASVTITSSLMVQE